MVDVLVVDRQRLVAAAGFEQVEGEVPPVVDGEQVAVAPVGLPGAQEADAVVDPALHLVHVGDGVDGPHVVGVAFDGGEAVVLGELVVPALLETEREHPAQVAVVRVGGVDGGQGSADAVAQVGGVAEEEVELVADEQAEQVGGPPDEEGVELAGGAVPVAGQPRVDGVAVCGFAFVEGERPRRPASSAAPARSGASVEVSDRYAARTSPIGKSGSSSTSDVIASSELVAVGEQVVDRGVVAVDRRRRAGDRVAVEVRAGGERWHEVRPFGVGDGSGAVEDPERQAQQRDETERLGAGPAVVAEHAGEPQIRRGLEAGDRRLRARSRGGGRPAPLRRRRARRCRGRRTTRRLRPAAHRPTRRRS